VKKVARFRFKNNNLPPFGRRKRSWRRYLHPRKRGWRCNHVSGYTGYTLADVPPGHQARIIDFSNTIPANRKEHLQAYGLVPGYQVKVIQQAPVTVVQIEHTELALERALAHAIRVEEIKTSDFPM
jgi:Fe2+ transport system protein FeoA